MKLPRISVIVPTWNRADRLVATVESALGQTAPPFEVIVVDDGSTDSTPEVAGRLPVPVRYVRQANAGVAAARNAGARVATGEFLAFLDCEDLWETDKLETQVAVHRAIPDAAWSVTDCTVIDLDDQPVPGPQGFVRVFPPFRATGLSPEDFFARDLARHEIPAREGVVTVFTGDPFRLLFSGNFGLPSSAMVQRDVFEAAGGFDPGLRLAEETEFFHRLAVRHQVAVVMRRLVRYRVGQAGALTSPANTSTLIRNALASQRAARELRPGLTPPEAEAARVGRRRLLLDLAWAGLASYDRATCREALDTLRAESLEGGTRASVYRGLSYLPVPVLKGLHWVKRVVR